MKLIRIGDHWINEDKIIGFFDISTGGGDYVIEARWMEDGDLKGQVMHSYKGHGAKEAELAFGEMFMFLKKVTL